MTKYVYRQRVVQAFPYNGEHLSALPDWVQNYQLTVPSPYGNTAVGTSATHDLLIPTASGVTTVKKGDWIVKEEELLYAIRGIEFEKIFEPESPEESALPPEATGIPAE